MLSIFRKIQNWKNAANNGAKVGNGWNPFWDSRPRERIEAEEKARNIAHQAQERGQWVKQNKLQWVWIGLSATTLAIAIVGAIFSLCAFKAAQSQANAAWSALIDVQRAFMVAEAPTLQGLEDGANDYRFKITIKNSGMTPTKNLSYLLPDSVQFFGDDELDIMGFKKPNIPLDPAISFYSGADKSLSYAVVGPQSALPDALITIPKSQLKSPAFSHFTKAAIFGAVVYNDIFPKSERHITKFCFMVDIATGRVDVCRYWNCADRECERDTNAYNSMLDERFQKAGKAPHPEMHSRLDWLNWPTANPVKGR